MVAGTLRNTGYFMGDNILVPKRGNPKGFFEDHEINCINEQLLSQVTPNQPRGWLSRFFRSRHCGGSRWLAEIPPTLKIPSIPHLAQRMAEQTSRRPFCFKDPRFSYTLPIWRPFLADSVFVCVFREPERTAYSIVKECREAPYLRKRFSMSFNRAVRVWELIYQHILDIHRYEGEWLFIHYDQMLHGSGIKRLEAFLGVQADGDFVESDLKRSPSTTRVGARARRIYADLCKLASFEAKATSWEDSELEMAQTRSEANGHC